MDLLEILQTIGICAGSLALVAIAIMLFSIVSSFVPSIDSDIEVVELREFLDEAESDDAPKQRRHTPKRKT